MSQPPAPPETTPPPDDGDDKLTLSGIARMMDERIGAALGKLFDSGKADVTEGAAKPGGDPAPGRDRSDVTAAVKAEVQALRADEAKQAAETGWQKRVEALEKALKPLLEAPPEEFRPITERLWR